MNIKERVPNLTLYARNPNKNYTFVNVGEIATWREYAKTIFIIEDGKLVLYELTKVESDLNG